jgi:hypothetical protein
MNDLPTYNGMPPLTPHKPTSLTDALRSGQQCNEDGVMCIVSRQACHEAEKAMREECTAPEGTYHPISEKDIWDAESATVEIASMTILALMSKPKP